MDDGDVLKQIHQMVEFIRQEAIERSNEFSVSADEVFSSSSSLYLSALFVLSSIQSHRVNFNK